MKAVLTVFYLLIVNIYGLSLDELIDRSLKSNPSIESIAHRLEASKSNIDLSTQFSNPTISYSQNTLDSKQAMSKKTLTIGQKIDFYSKRDVKEKISKLESQKLEATLILAKANLVYEIKKQAYMLWQLRELLEITKQYETLTKQNIGLSESYTSTSENQHMGIMSAQLSLTDLRIQENILESKITDVLSRLSYLSSFEVKDLDIRLSMGELKSKDEFVKYLNDNPSIILKDKEINKNKAMLDLVELDSFPDINIVAGYNKRENFDDYFSFGFAVSLPIYGTEYYKEDVQKGMLMSAKSLKDDVFSDVNSQYLSAYSQMKSAYQIYHIIHDEALPQIQHMYDLINASVSAGGDMFKYIDILKQKLKLEKQSIDAIVLFNTSLAKVSALKGEIE